MSIVLIVSYSNILLIKTTATRSEVVLSDHRVRRLYFPAAVSAASDHSDFVVLEINAIS